MERIPVKHFTYPLFSRISRFIFIVACGGSFVLSIRLLIIDIIIFQKNNLQILNDPAAATFVIFVVFIMLLISLNWDSHISISSEGISVQYFLFWQKFIVWDDVREIRRTIIFGHRLIIVRGLSPLHRLYGMIYGLTLQACIIVRVLMIDFDDAMATIRKQIDKHNRINAA